MLKCANLYATGVNSVIRQQQCVAQSWQTGPQPALSPPPAPARWLGQRQQSPSRGRHQAARPAAT